MSDNTAVLNNKNEFTSLSENRFFVSNLDQSSVIKTSIPASPDYVNFNDSKFSVEQDAEITVFDVASYILEKLPGQSCTTMKLHKLLYYSQAWSLVWDEKPLFNERIEAWANGPVIPDLFYYHKGLYTISFSEFTKGNNLRLSSNQKATVDSVLEYYGNKPAQWLIDLTHLEGPWKNARRGLSTYQRSNREIKIDEIANYYSSL